MPIRPWPPWPGRAGEQPLRILSELRKNGEKEKLPLLSRVPARSFDRAVLPRLSLPLTGKVWLNLA